MKKVIIKQSKNVLKRKENSKSINTQNKYNGDWLKFIDYCKHKHNCSPTDVDGLESAYNLVAEYLDWLDDDPEAKMYKGTSSIKGRENINICLNLFEWGIFILLIFNCLISISKSSTAFVVKSE